MKFRGVNLDADLATEMLDKEAYDAQTGISKRMEIRAVSPYDIDQYAQIEDDRRLAGTVKPFPLSPEGARAEAGHVAALPMPQKTQLIEVRDDRRSKFIFPALRSKILQATDAPRKPE